MAVDDRRQTARAPATDRHPDGGTRTLMFNVAFFGTLAWLGSGAQVAIETGDWWHRFGQVPLMLAGLILFWIGWWHVDKGRDRLAVTMFGPAVAALSVWVTSVHGTAF